MFLTVEDYRSVCDDYEFEQITQSPETREVAEAAALEQISSYLRSRYDIDRAFAASGSCRNAMLVQVAVNISLWLMVHRLPQNMGHERRECLYNDAVKWLAMSRAPKPPRISRFTFPRTATPTPATPCAPALCPQTDTTIKHPLNTV